MDIPGKYLFSKPRFLEKPYGWVQHIPFAFYLMETLRPETVTELGTHTGNSYFSFCQAADELKLNTKCYAVDTWEGDEHAGFYGKEVYDRVKKINTQHFFHLSYLLKMTFDDALSYFSDGSIDLLHIDGLHTYEAVKHDFECWLPKVSSRGVVIMHDTNVRERSFGVWKLFEEVRGQYPSFEFLHSHGLGILCVGNEIDKGFLDFVNMAESDSYVNHYFSTLGQRVFVIQERQDLQQNLQQAKKSLRQATKEADGFREEMDGLRQLVQSKQDEVESLSTRVNEYVKLDNGKNKTIQQLQEKLELLESQSAERQEFIERQRQDIDEKENELNEKNRKISDLESAGLELRLEFELEKEKAKELEKKITERHREEERRRELINQLNQEIAQKKQELGKIRQSLSEHQESLLTRQLEARELRQSLLTAQEQVIALENRNRGLLNNNTSLEAETLALMKAREDLRVLLTEREEQLKAQTEQHDKLALLLKKAEKEAESYKHHNELQKKELEELHDKLEGKNQELASTAQSVADYKQKATKHLETSELRKKHLESRNEKIGLLRRDLASAKVDNKLLKQQLKTKEAVLQAIVGSTSWRITQPVRCLGSLKQKISVKALFMLRTLFYILTFRLKQVRREFRHARYRKIINRSGMFDKEWYLESYPDVRKAGADPVIHYIRRGAMEKRDPSPDFSTEAYLNHYEDVAESKINPFVHYILFGKGEGRIVYQHPKLQDAANEAIVRKHGKFTGEHLTQSKKPKNWAYRLSEQELLDRVRNYNAQKELRKAKVVVYTAIIGDYDALILPETIVNEWDYVVFTDNEIEGEHIFEIRRPPFSHRDHTRMARYVKTHPHQLFPGYQCAVWIDSNILVRGDHLTQQVNRCLNEGVPLIINQHPDRKSVSEELAKCVKLGKDDPSLMDDQVKRYIGEGYPDDNGLFETNILIRNLNEGRINALNEAWWKEMERGSRRDQLSLPYVLWKHNIKAEPLPGVKNIRIHAGNDYCLFNHKGQNRNKNIAFFEPPSFLKTTYQKAKRKDEISDAAIDGASHLAHKQKDEKIIRDLRRKLLESGFEEKASQDLRDVAANDKGTYLGSRAAWELVVWHAGKNNEKDYALALQYLRIIDPSNFNSKHKARYFVMKAECYSGLNQQENGKEACQQGLKYSDDPNLYLAASNLETDVREKLKWVNKIYEKSDLMHIGSLKAGNSIDYDSLTTIHKSERQSFRLEHKGPIVSVIVPAHNASKTIATALNSLLVQTYDNLEILVVDDCSTDETVAIVRSFMEKDSRIRLLQTKMNQGPYVARNVALKSATGELITCNDADDWSHAEKIARQVNNLLGNSKLVANVSQWARLTESLKFVRRNNPGHYIQLNVSSLMFWRDIVLDKLGCWDSVRFGADTEFYKRLLRVFGRDTIEELTAIPLSFARYTENSLTGDPVTGYPGHPMGARREYRDSYHHHFNKNGNLRYKPSPAKRPFPIPKLMDPTVPLSDLPNRHFELVLVSDFRITDKNLQSILDSMKRNEPGAPKRLGLIHMEAYNLASLTKTDPRLRDAIDGNRVQMLVYGDRVSCDDMIVLYHDVLAYKQKYVPNVGADNVAVLTNISVAQINDPPFTTYLAECKKHLKEYFGKEGKWFPVDSKVLDLLAGSAGKEMHGFVEKELCPHPIKGMHWEKIAFKANRISFAPKETAGSKKKSFTKNGIVFLKHQELHLYNHENPKGVVVIMPCIDSKLGMETASFLLKRAGMDCLILVIYDEERLGFTQVLNNTSAMLNVKYVVYLAQDAYPGIDWLKIAYQTLERTGNGLLAFNDGKWMGRVASFGMVRMAWVRALYGGPVFFPKYKAHKADNELTVIARVQNTFSYEANATLVEIDRHKEFRENIPEDKELFRIRFRNGFDGLLSLEKLRPLAKSYFVPWKDESMKVEVRDKPVTNTHPEKSSNDPCSVYDQEIKAETIKRLQRDYHDKMLDKEEDHFVLYRIIGNDLLPRHGKGQSYNNLRFILQHESHFEYCKKKFVVNRIVDNKEEQKIIELLQQFKMPFLHIPFDEEEYKQTGFDTDCFPSTGFFASKEFQNYDEIEKGRAYVAALRAKNNYIMNNNGARNHALRDGKKIAKWVLPWDGNCFLTPKAWRQLHAGVTSRPHLKHFVVPMARMADNGHLLKEMPRPLAVEEPQIIFRKDSTELFDEGFPYGRRPKVELLWRLGVPGKWDHYPADDPWDPSRQPASKDAALFGCTSWVARLSSGNKEMEQDNRESIRKRVLARVDGIAKTIERTDIQLSGAKPEQLTSFRFDVLETMKQGHKGRYGNTRASLVQKLIHEAERAMKRGPYSVTDKKTLPPSGNPHDYWHPAPYWWPNENTADGLPYVRKDGVRVPGTRLYEPQSDQYDRTRIQRLFDDTTFLALAWYFTGNKDYASHAASGMERFFINPETKMNPHLLYGQVRLGHDQNRGSNTGIIETKDMYYFLDAVRLLKPSGVLSEENHNKFREWLASFFEWLLYSEQGKQECIAQNNHGTCYDLQVASIAAFLGEYSILFKTLARAQSRIPQQFDSSGRQVHEMKRTITAHYCSFNFQSWINLAEIASRFNVDLWSYTSKHGAGLLAGARWLIKNMAGKWPHKQIEAFDHERFLPIYFSAKEHLEIENPPKCFSKVNDPRQVKPLFFPHDGIRPFWNIDK